MTETGTIGEVDFSRQPYKGLVKEVAAELGITASAVSQRVKRRDPATLTLVLAKMKEREKIVREFDSHIRPDEKSA